MIKLGAGDEVSNIAKAEVTFVELHELVWNTIDSSFFCRRQLLCLSSHWSFISLWFLEMTKLFQSYREVRFCLDLCFFFIFIVHLFSF